MIKRCTKCNYEGSEFYKSSKSKDGLQSRCKTCHKLANTKYVSKRRQYNLNNKEVVRKAYASYNHSHKGRNCRNKYRKSDRGKTLESMLRAQRRGKLSVSNFTNSDWELLLLLHDHRCAYCGKSSKLTQDHVVSISKGGNHTIENIVPACYSCNPSKGNRDVKEWMVSRL